MGYIVTGCVVPDNIGWQFMGNDGMLIQILLKLIAFFIVFAQTTGQYAQSVICGIFITEFPAGYFFDDRFMLIQPGVPSRTIDGSVNVKRRL
jgi:hypothetical protein